MNYPLPKVLLVAVLCNLVLFAASSAFASPPESVFPSSINVKDYGARGDGKTDDTQAIQKAVNESVRQYEKQAIRVKHWDHHVSGSTYCAHPEIVFPPGIYRISETIVFPRFAAIRGIGKVLIQQDDPTKDIFYFHQNWQSHLENLQFNGGKTQLRFYTQNNDNSQIFVEHCTFTNSAGYAVECRSYMKKALAHQIPHVKPWAPYNVKWVDDQPHLTPNNADDLQSWFNSTLLSISYCQFNNCIGVANVSGDTSVIHDCEIATNPQTDGAIFNLSGEPHLYRIKGIANPAPGKHPYWISDDGILSVRDSDFGSSDAAGMGFIRLYQEPATYGMLCSVVDNCKIKVAGSPDNAIIWMDKGVQPSIISITNVEETSGKPVKALAWQDPAELVHLEDFEASLKGLPLQDQYKIQLSGNSPNINVDLPDALKPLLEKPIPSKALQETFVSELSWNYEDLEKDSGKILYAKNFGVDTDPKTDDTAAIQKVFDVAKQEGNCQVIFPGCILKLSKTIHLPSNVIVRGAGMPVFVQENPDVDIFNASNAQNLGFKNCTFEGGRNGVSINTIDTTAARIGFEECNFFDQSNTSIQCLAGDGKVGEANHTQLLFEQGASGTVRGAVTNAAHSEFDTFWPANDPRLNDQAFIENRGGEMRVQDMLAVPTLWQGKRGKIPADIKDWTLSQNTRWFDNWGKLYIQDSRFGGESGGMCNIYNRSQNGTIFVSGGIARFLNGATKKALIYFEENPQRAVLQNISAVPTHLDGSSLIIHATSSSDMANVFVAGVMAPE